MCFGRKVDTNGQIKSKGTHRFSAICKLDECTVNIVFGPKCLKVCKLLSGLCRLCRRRWTVFQVALQRRRISSESFSGLLATSPTSYGSEAVWLIRQSCKQCGLSTLGRTKDPTLLAQQPCKLATIYKQFINFKHFVQKQSALNAVYWVSTDCSLSTDKGRFTRENLK